MAKQKVPSSTTEVIFLESGTPYHYGYSAGERGFVKQSDMKLLQKNKVVRLLTEADNLDLDGNDDDDSEE